jgi:GDPmannose 4,6-dehydratase
MRLMLARPTPEDYVVASGEKHTVRDFVEAAFSAARLDWKKHVVEDGNLIKRDERSLVGNPAKLVRDTGWKRSVTFTQMVERLLAAERV